ncbi:isocitrate lyase/PEP mutase family protein [Rhodococcus sp. WS4]|nr:isocitrate lyase/PEP mutase family protein [Rhodococcus sp. WS4]
MTARREAQRRDFRALIESGETVVVPGAANSLTARIIADLEYKSVYVTGAGVANTYLGVPDIGLLTLSQLADHVSAMSEAVDIPMVVDADTGFGNEVNAWHTVRILEKAGASALQIEDQTFPKRCGHFEGKETISAEEMVSKIGAAIDARTDENLLIVARTDARYIEGIDEACRRASMYREAGADVTFVEAPQDIDEIERIAKEVEGPKVLNIVQGGKTPELSWEHAHDLGFSILLYANLALLAGVHGVRESLTGLKRHRGADSGAPRATWEQRQALVRKDFFDGLEARFGRY